VSLDHTWNEWLWFTSWILVGLQSDLCEWK